MPFVPMAGTHDPVLLTEVLEALNIRNGKTYVDGTLGLGGYTRAILAAADCRVIAIDRDPAAISAAREWAPAYGDRLTLIQGRFGDMTKLLPGPVDGITLDLGVSSPQLDLPERGFSFRLDGPLDMRMEGTTGGQTAADIVNTASEGDLADILFQYGEERASRRIAKAILEARKETPITRTGHLSRIIRKVMGRGDGRIDPSTRSFQALRIAVNDELGEITRILEVAPSLLLPGGRLAIVSFHSLEDRLVKNALRAASGGDGNTSRHLPQKHETAPELTLVGRKPVIPGTEECTRNPRARSARLRIAEKRTMPEKAGDA
ncbi:MAG TPA: 16S rRNA (cytosine(1402)-N(4))-methyltransferase [Rhodospirillaceae bacterium]|nr:MAG: 16S rRNA (cytosine(1402)-N(4))-methyltransferase [Alphaproteobacteria bacterium GWF2_58_20]HAU29995.1 16S rRNA (cytosine(1402)-N(4))-methyltransferase [Rhodospirillaceae bacterium]